MATGFAVSRRQPGASREVWHAGVPHWVAAVPKWAGEVVHLRVDGADAQVPEASRWSFGLRTKVVGAQPTCRDLAGAVLPRSCSSFGSGTGGFLCAAAHRGGRQPFNAFQASLMRRSTTSRSMSSSRFTYRPAFPVKCGPSSASSGLTGS